MALVMFLILAAYYELKTAREALILTEGGAEVKSYSSAGQALLLLGVVPAYGAFASRVNRGRLVRWVTLVFIGNITLFLLAIQAGLQVGIVYACGSASSTSWSLPSSGRSPTTSSRRSRASGSSP